MRSRSRSPTTIRGAWDGLQLVCGSTSSNSTKHSGSGVSASNGADMAHPWLDDGASREHRRSAPQVWLAAGGRPTAVAPAAVVVLADGSCGGGRGVSLTAAGPKRDN